MVAMLKNTAREERLQTGIVSTSHHLRSKCRGCETQIRLISARIVLGGGLVVIGALTCRGTHVIRIIVDDRLTLTGSDSNGANMQVGDYFSLSLTRFNSCIGVYFFSFIPRFGGQLKILMVVEIARERVRIFT